MGAWIEIFLLYIYYNTKRSLLAWERGLKYTMNYQKFYPTTVAPCVGAWIEILKYDEYFFNGSSLLAWERGLKSSITDYLILNRLSLLAWERGLKYKALM